MIFSERAEEFLERFGFRETNYRSGRKTRIRKQILRLDPKRCLGDYIEKKKSL